jgi:ribosome-associated protein
MSNSEFEDITIRDSMIRLGQLLKLASLVEDGVEAAELIKNGLVKVNGEIDERRGRQLHDGDTVTVNNRTVRISAPAAS